MGAGNGEQAVRTLGHYEVSGPLGAGGMGEVYLAHSPSGRAVAIKVIREELAQRPGFRERFAREVAAARQVSGAFTAPVVDADTTGPVPWMATQYVAGPTLAARVSESGPLTADAAWRLGSGLAEALRDIHRAGLVHRDLKPGNILLAEDGPRVIDFGISRVPDATALTESGQLLGTPPFMAPEQFRGGREAGPSADVFALGAVLVHAATGHGPFDADGAYAIAWKVVHEDPDLTGLPESLLPVVTACLAKDPADRPDADALLSLLGSRRERRVRVAVAEGLSRRRRLRRAALTAGSLAAVGALVAAAAVWRPWTGSGSPSAGPSNPAAAPSSSAPAPVRLAGWAPWVAQLPNKDPDNPRAQCTYMSAALLCSGFSVARLDPLTGAFLWQQPEGARNVRLLGTTESDLVVQDSANTGAVLRTFSLDTGKPDAKVAVPGGVVCEAVRGGALCAGPEGVSSWQLWAGGGKPSPDWTLPSGWGTASVPGGERHVVRTAEGVQLEVAEVVFGGEIKWRQKVPDGTRLAAVAGDVLFFADAVAGGSRTLVRVHRPSGEAKTVRLANAAVLLGIIGDVAYLMEPSGTVLAHDIGQDRQIWSAATLAANLSAPVAQGERLLFATELGAVVAVDRRSGGILWQRKPPQVRVPYGTLPSRPHAPVTLGEVVIALTPDLQIYSFDGSAP
ncbi:protein kinase domain-containing protein [Streptomyces sp. NPDC054956]